VHLWEGCGLAVEKADAFPRKVTESSQQTPPGTLANNHKGPIAVVTATVSPGCLFSARSCSMGSTRAEAPRENTLAITQIVGKSGEKLASWNLWFMDDLLSIRSQTLYGNSEFFAKIHQLCCGASTARAHCPSLLAIVVLPLCKTARATAGKTVPLPREWCAPKPAPYAPVHPSKTPAP
jgi:hypothetical protein